MHPNGVRGASDGDDTAADAVIPLAAPSCNSYFSASNVIQKAFFANCSLYYCPHYSTTLKGPSNCYIYQRSPQLMRGRVVDVPRKGKQHSSSHLSWSQNAMWSFYLPLLAFALYLAIKPSMVACSSSVQEQVNKNQVGSTCLRPVEKTNKNFALTPSKTKYFNEDHLIITCSSNKIRKTHKCINGVWEPQFDWLSECQGTNRGCPKLKPMENGFFTPSNLSTFPFGTKLYFQCNKNYDLVGAEILMCDVGLKWTFKPPYCNPSPSNGAGPRSHSYILVLSILASILSVIIISAMVFSAYQRRKRNKMQNQWRNYFSGYTYRASQRKITRRTPGDHQGTVYFTQEAAQITDL